MTLSFTKGSYHNKHFYKIVLQIVLQVHNLLMRIDIIYKEENKDGFQILPPKQKD